MFKVLGKGVVSGFIIVALTVILLPFVLDKSLVKAEGAKGDEKKVGFKELAQIEMGDPGYSLQIPKIAVNTSVVANVATDNQEVYTQALKNGVAHAKGTYLPGMDGGVTMFAHSIDVPEMAQDYGAVFYRLDELARGDKVIIWFEGEKFEYQVYRSWITDGSDTGVFKRIKNGERLFW